MRAFGILNKTSIRENFQFMLHPGLYLGVCGNWYRVSQAKLELHFSAFPSLYRARSALATRETCAKFGKKHQAAAGDITFGRRVQGPIFQK